VILSWDGMAVTPALETELSSRAKEASKRRSSCGREKRPCCLLWIDEAKANIKPIYECRCNGRLQTKRSEKMSPETRFLVFSGGFGIFFSTEGIRPLDAFDVSCSSVRCAAIGTDKPRLRSIFHAASRLPLAYCYFECLPPHPHIRWSSIICIISICIYKMFAYKGCDALWCIICRWMDVMMENKQLQHKRFFILTLENYV
jgi:hypothetical protein